MRTIACGSSNRNSASALVSSVLPTPVGPRNRNEPSGRFGSCSPARARRIGAADRLRPHPPGRSRACRSPLPSRAVSRARPPASGRSGCRSSARPRAAMSSAVTSSRSIALPAGRCGLGELLLELGDAAVLELAGLGEIAGALRLLELEPRGVELLLDLAPRPAILSFSACQRWVSSADCCSRLASSPSSVFEPVLARPRPSPSSAPRARS